MPILYLVGTPIGNLEDVTLRALRVLREAGLIAAEDTRKSKVLLDRYQIRTPVVSYHEQGQRSRADALAARLADHDIALITEAGMPSISDPGFSLVRAALERGYRVEAVPGPSAPVTAAAVSGLPADQFLFAGFLPRTRRQRKRFLGSLKDQPRTLIVFEAPHRLTASLQDVVAELGDRRIAVCRELTKRFEEVFRGTVSEAAAYFERPRGEFTLVIEGLHEGRADQSAGADHMALLERLYDAGVTGKEAVARVVQETGRPRREVYKAWLALKTARAAGCSVTVRRS